MPFKEDRAFAFAEYTLPALMEEQKGKILTVARQDLADVLCVEKLWDKHIDLIRKAAEKFDVGTANLGSRIAFVSLARNPNVRPMKPKDAKKITDRFEAIYGSRAADELWESKRYRS